MTTPAARDARVGGVVAGVLLQLLADSGASAFLVAGENAPEACLVRRWIERAAGPHALARAAGPGVLVAEPVSKTALLLDAATPRDAAVLPVGDLYASQLVELAGGWTPPPTLAALVAQAGELATLDDALARWVERRERLEDALAGLPAAGRVAVAEAIAAGRLARRRLPLVPKLAWRTAGIDLFA